MQKLHFPTKAEAKNGWTIPRLLHMPSRFVQWLISTLHIGLRGPLYAYISSPFFQRFYNFFAFFTYLHFLPHLRTSGIMPPLQQASLMCLQKQLHFHLPCLTRYTFVELMILLHTLCCSSHRNITVRCVDWIHLAQEWENILV